MCPRHDHRRVLINAQSEHPGVLRERSEQTLNAGALCEVLIDYHVAHERQSAGHYECTLNVVLLAAFGHGGHQHGLPHTGRAR